MLANHMYYKITQLLHGYSPPIFLFSIKENSKNSTHPFYDPLFITCARVSIPKIRILAQILRPVYIFPKKSKLKITYILKCMEILIYIAIRHSGKIPQIQHQAKYLTSEKVNVSRKVGAKNFKMTLDTPLPLKARGGVQG